MARRSVAVVIPAKDEGPIVEKTIAGITDALGPTGVDLTVICVDDGSRDDTWQVLQRIAAAEPRLFGVKLSRNYGHDAAVFTGLKVADADAVVTMDADGQHPFASLPEMLRLWEASGCDVVNGVKRQRHEGILHNVAAGSFSKFLSWTMNQNLMNATEFKLLSRRAVAALLACGDHYIFYRALVPWIGLKQLDMEFDLAPGFRRDSRWGLRSLVRFAISGLIMFSSFPLLLILWLGLATFALSLVLFAKLLFALVTAAAVPEGYSTLLALMLLSLSFNMIGLGVIGIYVQNTFRQTLRRPRAIIEDICHQGGTSADTGRFL